MGRERVASWWSGLASSEMGAVLQCSFANTPKPLGQLVMAGRRLVHCFDSFFLTAGRTPGLVLLVR